MHRGCSCGRRCLPFRVRGGHARVPRVCACACFLGRVGAPHLFLWPLLVPSLSSRPLRAGVALLVVFPAFIPSCAPLVSGVPCFPALGALGLVVLCPSPPPLFWVFLFFPLFCAPLVSGVTCFPALGALGLGVLCPPPLLFFFPVPSSASCAVLRLCVPGSGACWCVLLSALCFGGGLCALALHRLVPPVCASSFCVVACFVARARWGRPGGLAPPRAAAGVCRSCPPAPPPPPPPPPFVVSSVVLRRASCRVAPRSVVCVVLCPVVCGVLVSGWVLAPCCLARCCAGLCCAVFVLLCCPALLRSLLVLGSGLVTCCFSFCAPLVRCCAGVPASLLSVLCSLALAALAGVLCFCLLCLRVCCWAWLSSVVSWWVLVAPGVVFRWCAVVCPWVPCCAVLLRVVPPGVALLCAVLFCFAPFGAAVRPVVSWGAGCRPGVLCLLVPCFVLSPRAVCVLLWCVPAWCCSPLCFVLCAPWGVVLCASCRLRPVRCCYVARSPSVPCSPVLCPVVLCCRVVLWRPVLLPCWVCFLRLCGFTYLKNRCKIC